MSEHSRIPPLLQRCPLLPRLSRWWFLKGIRAQLSYDTTAFEGGAAAGGDRESEGVVVTRLQVSL
jgi:hypothetical protein